MWGGERHLLPSWSPMRTNFRVEQRLPAPPQDWGKPSTSSPRAWRADPWYSRVDPGGQPWEVGLKLVPMGRSLAVARGGEAIVFLRGGSKMKRFHKIHRIAEDPRRADQSAPTADLFSWCILRAVPMRT